jgi:uncharacterized protein (DUF2147 family)
MAEGLFSRGCRASRSIPRPERQSTAVVSFIAVLLMCLMAALPRANAAAAIPPGVWLIDGKVAVQIYACSKLLCGRILWLQIPRNSAGALDVDENNPTPSLRQRRLCGLTIIWGLRALGDNKWGGGRFYNPEDGYTYSIAAELVSDDLIEARIFARTPLLGQTKSLTRVSHGTSDGWC